MRMWLVLFIVLTLSSVANGTLDYNILKFPSREWDSSLQTITVEGYCFPEHCGRNVAKFNDLTVTLQLFDGTAELNDAPTVRISLFSFEIFLQISHFSKNDRISHTRLTISTRKFRVHVERRMFWFQPTILM